MNGSAELFCLWDFLYCNQPYTTTNHKLDAVVDWDSFKLKTLIKITMSVCFWPFSDIDPPRLDPNIAYFGSGSLITHKYICTAGDSNPPPILFQWFRNNILLNESSTKEITGTGFEVKRIQNAIILNLPDNFMDLDEKFSCHIGNGLKTLSMDLKFQHGKFNVVKSDFWRP